MGHSKSARWVSSASASTAAGCLAAASNDSHLITVDAAGVSTLLYHGLRRAELCALVVGDVHPRRGVTHLRIHGKGGKLRYLPLHPATAEAINV